MAFGEVCDLFEEEVDVDVEVIGSTIGLGIVRGRRDETRTYTCVPGRFMLDVVWTAWKMNPHSLSPSAQHRTVSSTGLHLWPNPSQPDRSLVSMKLGIGELLG